MAKILTQKSLFNHWALCWLSACLIVACGESPAAKEIVALIGKEAIGKSEVEKFAELLSPALRSRKSGHEARLDYLKTLIDEELLVLEARAQGLDTTRAFKSDLEKTFRRKVVDHYLEHHLVPRLTISEEELRERFLEEGLNRRRALSRVIVKTAEEAAQLRERLKQGAEFAALARTHSLEKGSAADGGYMGFIDRAMAAKLFIPPQVFAELPSGEISPPLRIRSAHQLLRFTEEQEATDLTPYRQHLSRSVWKKKMAIERRAMAEKLAYEFGLHLQKEGFEILRSKQPGSRQFPQLSDQEAMTPLYVYDQGKITVGEYIDMSRETGAWPGLGDSLKVIRAAWREVIPEVMFWEAGRQKGYHEIPSMLEWKARQEVTMLLVALRRTAVSAQVVISDGEAEQFYRDNPRLFEVPAEVWIQEILVDDLDQATELRQRLDSGEDMAALIHLSQRPGAGETGGELHLYSYAEPIYGDLVQQALAAAVGQLVGPVETEGGYSVCRLLKKSGGQLQPFAKVAQRAKASLQSQKEDQLFNVLVSAVREKYADQVHIFEDVLSEVRLPEENALSPEGDTSSAL